MRPKERRDSRQNDLFWARLEANGLKADGRGGFKMKSRECCPRSCLQWKRRYQS